jgi:peptidoglycan/LPS O-acetylase OafA/YrhL
MKKKIAEIPILNSLRAFAALSVCLFHFICTTTGFITNPNILSIFSFGKYGVQLFFVISGFIIPWSMFNADYQLGNWAKFLLKRIIRLEPPYLISVLLAIIIITLRIFILRKSDLDFTFTQIFLHIGYLIPFFDNYNWINQVYWTLAIEFQYYFFISFFFIALNNNFFSIRYLSYLIMICGGLISNSSFLPYWLPVFLIGVLIFQLKMKIVNIIEYISVTIISFLVIIYKHDPGELIYIVLGIVILLFYSKKDSKIGNLIGEFSYTIYLTHTIIGASFINILSHYVNSPLIKAVVIGIGILITLFSSFIIYNLVEKPSKKLSSRIIYKK